jgi:hypothetical protein
LTISKEKQLGGENEKLKVDNARFHDLEIMVKNLKAQKEELEILMWNL